MTSRRNTIITSLRELVGKAAILGMFFLLRDFAVIAIIAHYV